MNHYAYLKPFAGESPYYLHITLDDRKQTARLFYSRSDGKEDFESLKQLAALVSKKGDIKVKQNSIKFRGRCHMRQQMLRDAVSFVEPDTAKEIPAKILCHASRERCELILTLPYRSLGRLPAELKKLAVFTENPDFESVKRNLPFFQISYVIEAGEGVNSKKPEEEQEKAKANEITFDPAFCKNTHPYAK